MREGARKGDLIPIGNEPEMEKLLMNAPAADEDGARQRGDPAARPDERLISLRKGTNRRKFAGVALSSQQCRSEAFAAGVLVGNAARLCLSRSENSGWSRLLSGQNERSCTENRGCERYDSGVHHCLPRLELITQGCITHAAEPLWDRLAMLASPEHTRREAMKRPGARRPMRSPMDRPISLRTERI